MIGQMRARAASLRLVGIALIAAFTYLACGPRVPPASAPPSQAKRPHVNYDAVTFLLGAKNAERAGNHAEAVIMWEAAVRADGKSPSLQLGLAEALLAVGRDSLAVVRAKESIKLDSTFSDGHDFLAEYYRRHGDFERAARHLEASLRHSYDKRAAWRLIHLYNQLQRRDEGRRVLEKLARHPQSAPSDLLQWANIADNMRMTDSAEMLYRMYIARWPESDTGILAYGAFLGKRNRTAEEERVYRQGLQSRPQSTRIRHKLVGLLVEEKRWAEADSIMASSRPVSPHNLDEEKAWLSLLLKRGQPKLAAAHAERLIRSFPDDADLLVLLGQARAATGDYRQAAVAFGQAAARDSSIGALSGLIYSQIQARAYPEAERSARSALRRFPGDVQLKLMLGTALRMEERWADAAEVFAELVRVAPTNAEYLFDLGSSLERSGQFDEAVAVFRRLLTKEPHEAVALNYLGYMFAERGVHLDEALRLITDAVAQEPRNAAYLDSMGWTLYRLGRHRQAKRFLLEAIKYEQTSAVIYEHLGDVCESLGERGEARTHWQQALALEPSNARIRAKLGKLTRE